MLEDIQDEIDEVMKGKSRPDYDDIVAMKKLRMALIESLRLYPEPPILIRRALKDDVLPAGGSNLKNGIKVSFCVCAWACARGSINSNNRWYGILLYIFRRF